MRSWTVPALILALSCGPKAPPPDPTPPPPPPKPTAVVPQVNATSVGPLNSDFKASEESLASAFPGYQIATTKRMAEGEEVPAYELSRNGTLSMTVEPNSDGGIYRVTIVDAEAVTPTGIKVGDGYEKMASALSAHQCYRLVDERADSVACYANDSASIGYVLGGAAKGFKGNAGSVPPKKVLAKASVTEILWLPESE